MRAAWPGHPSPLGADWDGEGTNFAVFSQDAEAVELVLYDEHGAGTPIELVERTDFHWHGYLYGVGPGQRYGYRVHGPYEPAKGLRFNSRKMLIDPYARAITGRVKWGPEVFGYRWTDSITDGIPSDLDSEGHAILDVVYNHTAEGNHLGPTLSFRGIDNASYYRLVAGDPRYYFDVTGTGNTLNVRQPQSLQLITDSLRYWVTEMHVDGFRFDLAAALARQFHDVDRLSAFFDIIHQDPVLARVKLITEPWDIGDGGYQVGNFPVRWAEWNGRYRDLMRDYWRGQTGGVSDVASRLTGSADLYEGNGRGPSASVNFITAHDGFTLRDLVSYEHKHNEANREDNRDGTDDNRSWNCGVDGETDDPEVLDLRGRQQRNMLTSLFLSLGTPMLLHGDELGRTQGGNNNAYCQDNELSWIDWGGADVGLLDFTRRLIWLRRDQPVLHRRRFFQGRLGRESRRKDIAWVRRNGDEMRDEDWQSGERLSVGMVLNGDLIADRTSRGEAVRGDTLLVLFHAHHEDSLWQTPSGWGDGWAVLIDTNTPDEAAGTRVIASDGALPVRARSVVVLRRLDGAEYASLRARAT